MAATQASGWLATYASASFVPYVRIASTRIISLEIYRKLYTQARCQHIHACKSILEARNTQEGETIDVQKGMYLSISCLDAQAQQLTRSRS